jgi:PIN domain nuclease of toxin-antitoxin system
MTIRAVADTHTVLWYLYNDSRLSAGAGTLLDATDAAGDQVAVSSIALAEMAYLIEKGWIDAEALDGVLTALNRPDAMLIEVPLDQVIVRAMRRVDRGEVPDMPDRIIAATALNLGVPLISRDRKIRLSAVVTIW